MNRRSFLKSGLLLLAPGLLLPSDSYSQEPKPEPKQPKELSRMKFLDNIRSDRRVCIQEYHPLKNGAPKDMLTLVNVTHSEYDHRLFLGKNLGDGEFAQDREILRVYEQRRAGPSPFQRAPIIPGQLVGLGLGDITEDGNLDIMALVEDTRFTKIRRLYLLKGDGNGNFQKPTKIRDYTLLKYPEYWKVH